MKLNEYIKVLEETVSVLSMQIDICVKRSEYGLAEQFKTEVYVLSNVLENLKKLEV